MNLKACASDIIQAVMAVITAVGILIAVSANRNQLETFNDQLKLNFFADYTKRYQEIILNLPDNIYERDFDLQKLDKTSRNNALKYLRAYFNLCSEEFHLNKESHIETAVWKIWEAGIRQTLTKKAFRDAWALISRDTMYDEAFTRWVDGQIAAPPGAALDK